MLPQPSQARSQRISLRSRKLLKLRTGGVLQQVLRAGDFLRKRDDPVLSSSLSMSLPVRCCCRHHRRRFRCRRRCGRRRRNGQAARTPAKRTRTGKPQRPQQRGRARASRNDPSNKDPNNKDISNINSQNLRCNCPVWAFVVARTILNERRGKY